MSSKSGIYQIRNLVNGKVYIGSACRLNSRKSDHLRSLQRGNHVNQKLQRAWNKYGPSAFESALMQGKKWTPEQIAKRVATKRAKREAAQA